MNNSLWVAKTGLDAQQTRMTVISNNLANASTTGFKRDRANFEDTLYQTVRQPGGASSEQTALPTGMQVGTGSRVVSTSKLFTQGGLNQTGNPLDIAINGRGFIEVMMPDGTSAYTRDGALSKNSEGELVTSAGYQVQPGIVIPETADSLTIGRDGTITARDSATNTETVIGQLTLTDFINPTGLQAIGENLFRETAASGPPNNSQAGVNGMGLIVQNALEGSNVNVVEELVGMIEAQRAYETNAKAISTSDAMLGFLNQTL